MIERYLDWIVAYVSEHPVRNRCQEATCAMKEAFPELERVAGFAHTDRGSVEHWWCLGPDGVVYDPTSIQFESVFSYEPWKPGDEIRVGRCLACGGDIFKRVDKLGGLPECVCENEECFQALKRQFEVNDERERRRFNDRLEQFVRDFSSDGERE